MALPSLSQGQIAYYGGIVVAVVQPSKDGGTALVVDARRQLYEVQPSACDAVPREKAGRAKFVLGRIARSAGLQRRLKARGVGKPRHRVVRKQTPGTYGSIDRPVGFNSHRVRVDDATGALLEPPNSFKGYPARSDEPTIMAEGLTGTPTNRLIRHFQLDNVALKRAELESALYRLSRRHPVDADVFRRVHLGGVVWHDEHGRALDCPMTAAEVARQRGTGWQAVSNALHRADKALSADLGYPSTRYCPYATADRLARRERRKESE